MERRNFYLATGAVNLLSLAAASILVQQLRYAGVLAASLGLASILLLSYIEKETRKTGRDRGMKVSLVSTAVLYELILLLGAFSLPVIPKYAAAITLAAIAFNETLDLEIARKIRVETGNKVGRDGRMVALVASLAAYSFNEFYLFYGVVFIFLLASYDSLTILHRIRTEVL